MARGDNGFGWGLALGCSIGLILLLYLLPEIHSLAFDKGVRAAVEGRYTYTEITLPDGTKMGKVTRIDRAAAEAAAKGGGE